MCGSLNVSMLAYVQETGAAVNSRFKPDASEIVKVDFLFFFEVRLLYTTQGDPVPVVLISQLSTPLGDKWSETVAHIWKSPKPVSHQCSQRASTGASSSLNMCVQFMGRYVFWCPGNSITPPMMPTWAGGSHAAALCLFFRSTLSS